MDLDSLRARYRLVSDIEITAKLLPKNSSATNLATVLASIVLGEEPSFSFIRSKVAAVLFQALSTIPYLSQVSYIGLNGIFFSYYKDGGQTFAVYSNTTFTSKSRTKNLTYSWYTQPVYSSTGNLYGIAKISQPLIVTKESWFQKSMNSSNGYASLGMRWNSEKDRLFLNTVGIEGLEGAISFGFPMKELMEIFPRNDGGSLYMATLDGEELVQGEANASFTFFSDNMTASVILMDPMRNQKIHGDVSCKPHNGKPGGNSSLKIEGTEFIFYCSPIDVVGVQSVYMLAFPNKGLESIVHKTNDNALVLFIVMMIALLISMLTFLYIVGRARNKEAHLCSALIREMEATQQAERKSTNKSLAFASASHDVRAALAGLTGLIDLSYPEAVPGSDLETNLRQMDTCAKDLLELLNSILDMSKVEAGKMQLDEEEFNLSQLLEDVADLYHPVGMKRGVDVVLDFCDGSALKFSHVKGDRGKLKQILCNLLSNAVKFTSEGHISIRAWAQKPTIENSIIANNLSISNFMNWISSLFFKNKEFHNLEELKTIKQDPRCMTFVMEVDDTGKGIPKEKRKSVFEKYVQVEETAVGIGGTGLGLGIVQSLVQMMGGHIEIVDKEHGERGTCFRFSVYFKVCDSSHSSTDTSKQVQIESDDHHCISSNSYPNSGKSIYTPSPKLEASLVILLIRNNERRRMVQTYMKRMGVNLVVLKKGSDLPRVLKKIKHQLASSSQVSSSGLSDPSPRSCLYSSGSSLGATAIAKSFPLSGMDGANKDDLAAVRGRKINIRSSISCVLMVIDTGTGDFTKLCRSVAHFRKDLHNNSSCSCQVVWLEKPDARNLHFQGLEEENLAPMDHVITKPFHGSRLYQVIRLLPEFGENLAKKAPSRWNRDNMLLAGSAFDPTSIANYSNARVKIRNSPANIHLRLQGEIQEVSSSSSDKLLESRRWWPTATKTPIQREAPEFGSSSSEKSSARIKIEAVEINKGKGLKEQGEAQKPGCSNSTKPLQGKRILIAEDNILLARMAVATVSHLGASAFHSRNGVEAVALVTKGLQDQTGFAVPTLPFDYILMDCKMPEMDGFEATKRIRREEQQYGIHIPIIALTAHTVEEVANKINEAGMDSHLMKPLKEQELLKIMGK
ncbi:hypothetical protein Nepgr_004150 [Nepenthes gracilis]|uniref:histidine kinase n=1 Tax=Nepenthes gracilis TaxID=150966 RepID=A0AAD3XEY9_NEPGR|nr:hypothetical protein Nepgr_004150 [Nepenthes gracilis]